MINKNIEALKAMTRNYNLLSNETEAIISAVEALREKSKNALEWIKVDAEHMPDDMRSVMLTVTHENKKSIFPCGRWNQEKNRWEWSYGIPWYCCEEITETVTHWMPYPEPAQD